MKTRLVVLLALAGAVLAAQPQPPTLREPLGLREEKHLIDRLTRILAWYDKYLMPVRPSATSRP